MRLKKSKNYLRWKTPVPPRPIWKKYFSEFLYSLAIHTRKKWIAPKNPKMSQVVKGVKFQNSLRDMNFFSYSNFYRRFRIWTHNWQKFCNLSRGRHFVHFWHFREDWSDYSQTPPEYRRRHFHQKSRKKIGNNYSHLAIIAIWNFKNWQNFKNCKNFKSVVETWIFIF